MTSSEETGLRSTRSACPRARAVATPIRRPVNVPGPVPTAIDSTSSQVVCDLQEALDLGQELLRVTSRPEQPVLRRRRRVERLSVVTQHARARGRARCRNRSTSR